MTTQETNLWQHGITDAPLPPLADPRDLAGSSRPFVSLYRTLGPVFRLPRRDQALTVLAGPEANAFVTRYGDEFFTTREQWEAFGEAMDTADFVTRRDGAANRERRARISRDYSRAKALDQLPRMIELTHEHTDDWLPGRSIALLPAMQRVIAEQLGQLLVHHGMGDYLEDFLTYLDTSIMTSFGGQSQEALASPEFQHARDRAYELGRAILQDHQDHPLPGGKPDLVDDALAEASRASVKPEDLERVGLGPLLAGLDTVANTSSFMLFALLKHPAVLRRVLDEVDAAFAQGVLTKDTLRNMPALHGAAMETLRLYPVAGGSMMSVAQPLTFGGYRLDPGEQVYVAMSVSHFLPELYEKPEEFDIDRFHDPRNEHRQRGAYAPFGLGDHICLGAGIAEVQLMVTPATLLHTYQLALDPPDYVLETEDNPTFRPKNLRIKVIGRRPNRL